MNKEKLLTTRKTVQNELRACIKFWLENGLDKENGGVHTCLDRTGKLYSTDKSVWMQGRCAWTFAYLCNVYGENEKWRQASLSCLDFLEKYCINRRAGGRLYFTVTGDGKPLRQRRYFFSEAFYAMANAEYYALSGEKVYLDRAKRAYEVYWKLWRGAPDPAGLGAKTIPETRRSLFFANPMICLNMSSILIRADSENRVYYEKRASICTEEIFKYHVHPEISCLLENVGPNGEARLDFTEGRIVNPGHDMEGVWFLLEHARRTSDGELVKKCEKIFDDAYRAGWDKEYSGLLYFVDALGFPPEAYEHDMKLWWPHNELLIAALMLYRDTGKEKYLDIFFDTFDYCEKHFADPRFGEWYGYLRRDGKPTEPPCKGSTYKGPFHLPRMLAMVDVMIGEITGEGHAGAWVGFDEIRSR